MEREEKQRITENLLYITANTRDLKRLIISLVCEGLLSKENKQTIESFAEDSEKIYRLFTEVMKVPKYKELINILDETGNDHIADKLRNLQSPSHQNDPREGVTSTEDFAVSRNGASEIVYILSEYSSLQDVWVDNIARPLLSARSFSNLKTDASHTAVMMKTLDAWLADKGRDATLRSLANTIDRYNHAASVALLDNAKKIRFA